jgi:hypothetical protein
MVSIKEAHDPIRDGMALTSSPEVRAVYRKTSFGCANHERRTHLRNDLVILTKAASLFERTCRVLVCDEGVLIWTRIVHSRHGFSGISATHLIGTFVDM